MLITNYRGKAGHDFMCGRFVIYDEGEIAEINQILKEVNMKFDGTGIIAKTGEIFPTNNVPVLTQQAGKPIPTIMKWGFPKWDGKGVIINAKSETAAEKKMFAKSLIQRRCVIPSNGFYEWAKAEGKTKYRFNVSDTPMLYMAGLYAVFSSDGQERMPVENFSILTCAANKSISDIHERMPVILRKDEIVGLLNDFAFACSIMQRDTVNLIREAV